MRSFAERTAMNTPIQGSAADIIKKAMIDMAGRLKAEKLQTRLLLQVHDELIFEAPPEEIETLKIIVPDVMENAVELKVPLRVDYSYGPNLVRCEIKKKNPVPGTEKKTNVRISGRLFWKEEMGCQNFLK